MSSACYETPLCAGGLDIQMTQYHISSESKHKHTPTHASSHTPTHLQVDLVSPHKMVGQYCRLALLLQNVCFSFFPPLVSIHDFILFFQFPRKQRALVC